MMQGTPSQNLVAVIADNLHMGSTPLLVEPGVDRATVAFSVCAALSSEVPEPLRHSSETTVLATRGHVVRVAKSGRSRIDVTQLTDAALVLRSSGVLTPEPIARLVVAGQDVVPSSPGEERNSSRVPHTWEVSVWRRYRNDGTPDWQGLGAAIGTLHDADPCALGALPPFSENLERGRRRVEHYDQEVPGLLRLWESLSTQLYESAASGVIHGDMTIGNVLWGSDVLVCDLEALCTGPREWDLAKLHESVVKSYGISAFVDVLRGYPHSLDATALDACVSSNRIKTATWALAECDAGMPSAPRRELLATLSASVDSASAGN